MVILLGRRVFWGGAAQDTLTIHPDTLHGSGKVSSLIALVNHGTLTLRGAVDQVCYSVRTGASWGSSSTASTASALDISSASSPASAAVPA
jgi:hypothetical protein